MKDVKTKIIMGTIIAIIVLVLFGLVVLLQSAISNYYPDQSSELLPYYGAALSFFGTFSLALVTLWQTQTIEKKNAEMMALRDKWEKENTKRPFFTIEEAVVNTSRVHVQDDGSYQYSKRRARETTGPEVYSWAESLGPILKLTNMGDGPAINLRYIAEESFWPHMSCEPKLTCLPDESVMVRICFRWRDGAQDTLVKVGELYYENILGQSYSQSFQVRMKKTYFFKSKPADISSLKKCDESDMDYKYTIQFEPIGCQEVCLERKEPERIYDQLIHYVSSWSLPRD